MNYTETTKEYFTIKERILFLKFKFLFQIVLKEFYKGFKFVAKTLFIFFIFLVIIFNTQFQIYGKADSKGNKLIHTIDIIQLENEWQAIQSYLKDR